MCVLFTSDAYLQVFRGILKDGWLREGTFVKTSLPIAVARIDTHTVQCTGLSPLLL